MATSNNPHHSAHRPGTGGGRDEPQTAGKTTADQRARPVHQVPPRACQAKQGPLRAVLQKDPGIRNQEKSRSQTGQVDQGVSLSHTHRAKRARRKSGLLFAVSQTGRRATMDHAPAGDKNDGEYTVAARICMATVHPGLTIAHLYQRVCYTGLTATTSEARGLTIAHLYQRVCYTGLTATTSEAQVGLFHIL